MYEGHIKLFRRLKKSSYYQDSQYVHLWVHLLMSVNWTPKRIKLKNSDRFIDLLPGQILTSRKALVGQTGIDRSKIERVLKAFENEQQIEQQTFSKYRVISVTNWQQYQRSEHESEQQMSITHNKLDHIALKLKSEHENGQKVSTNFVSQPIVIAGVNHSHILDREQQMSSKRAADEQQMSTNKKVKKEKKEPKRLSASDDAVSDFYLSKKKRKLSGKRLETFDLFWTAFDYKRDRANAADAWLDIPALTETLVGQIVAAAKREAFSRAALLASGGTPKMAQGWITARRWEDETPITKTDTGIYSPVTADESERLKRAMAKYEL